MNSGALLGGPLDGFRLPNEIALNPQVGYVVFPVKYVCDTDLDLHPVWSAVNPTQSKDMHRYSRALINGQFVFIYTGAEP